MKLIDLTMPVWPGAGYGEILPFTNTPVDFVEYMDYAKNGMRQTRMKLNGETGSPLMVPAQHAPFDMNPIQKNPRFHWTLDEIPIEELVLHDTAVLDISAGEGHEINADEMATALKVADFREGDHVLLRSGWGTIERAYEMGIDYLKKSPSVHYEAAVLLADKMEELNSHIFMTDCAFVNPPRVQGYNWFLGDAPLTPLPKPCLRLKRESDCWIWAVRTRMRMRAKNRAVMERSLERRSAVVSAWSIAGRSQNGELR
jgi:kynurenine formamidase